MSHHAVVSQVLAHDDFLRKLAAEFTTAEQRMFTASFAMYMAHILDPGAFVVDIDDVVPWAGLSRKDAAVRILKANFEENVDFQTGPQPKGAVFRGGGHNKDSYMLTVDAFKSLCMLARTTKGTKVRKYFIKMEGVLFRHLAELLAAPATPDEVGLVEAGRNARRRLIAGGVEAYNVAARVSVQMVVDELVRARRITRAAARAPGRLSNIGAAVARRFRARANSGEVVPHVPPAGAGGDGARGGGGDGASGGFLLTWNDAAAGEPAQRISRVTAEIAALCRMRHSVAYGLREVHAHAVHDAWTYPAAFRVDMEELACVEFGVQVVMRAELSRVSPWG